MTKTSLPLNFDDLHFASSQVWGSIRLVPIVRQEAMEDIRLSKRTYASDLSIVRVDKKNAYVSYIPHGLVVDWSSDGSPLVAYGASLNDPDIKKAKRKDQKRFGSGVKIGLHDKNVKRETRNRLRMMPLHFSLEGLLLLLSKAPTIAWSEYNHKMLASGTGNVVTSSVSGWGIPYLKGALEHFEIHQDQVGVLVFVSDHLASAFVLSHPDDYKSLHQSIIEDIFCEHFWLHGYLYSGVPCFSVSIDDTGVSSLDGLEQAFVRMKEEWGSFQAGMASALLKRPLLANTIYQQNRFSLQRFVVNPNPEVEDLAESLSLIRAGEEHHIGEVITRDDGRIAYLKTYRLSRKQCYRLKTFSQLAKHDWHLQSVCADLGVTPKQFQNRLKAHGLEYIARAIRSTI